MNPDDLPTIWAIPLDDPPTDAPAPTLLPFPTSPPERDESHLILFRDSDDPPPEGFVPKLRSA